MARKKNKKMKSTPYRIEQLLQTALQYHEKGRLDKAEKTYRKVLKAQPDHPDGLHFLGLIAGQSGRMKQAEDLLRRSIQMLPQNAIYHHNLGTFLKGQSRWQEAIGCYKEAVRLQPSYADAYYHMGAAFLNEGNLPKAVTCFQKTIALRPDFAEAHNNLGNALQDLGRLEEAMDAYKKALALAPAYPEAYCQLFFLLCQTCNWPELEDLKKEFLLWTNRFQGVNPEDYESPFVSVAMHPDPARNLAVAKIWSTFIAEEVSRYPVSFTFDLGQKVHDKIIVGYLSSDFHDHAIAHLMLGLFGLHDRNTFEIHAYSHGTNDGSAYRQRIEADCDRFFDVAHFGFLQTAKIINENHVHILVDLNGYTTGGKMHIPALHPAPIQVSYLGFPGTTGADFFDYIITDKIVTPEDQRPYYSEKCVYLPHCYQVNDHAQGIAEKVWKKSDVGLPEEDFVFCSFNQGYKIDPVMFRAWMRIMTAVPRSVLWLMVKTDSTQKNLKHQARLNGISPDRIIFAERLPKPEHLARLSLADLVLDTRIYNGHTTTSDALWAGVPVVALQGAHFASRVSSSLLTAIGLPELITDSLEDYERLAVHLALHPADLQGVKNKLDTHRPVAPLFDTPRFVVHLEKAYRNMWSLFLRGEKPQHLEIVDE